MLDAIYQPKVPSCNSFASWQTHPSEPCQASNCFLGLRARRVWTEPAHPCDRQLLGILFHRPHRSGRYLGSPGPSINAVWDAANDPLFGYWSDRTRHPRGRCWSWLRFGLPLYILFVLPLWFVSGGLQGFWLFAYFVAFSADLRDSGDSGLSQLQCTLPSSLYRGRHPPSFQAPRWGWSLGRYLGLRS